jgi:hypothetical protein
MDEWFRTEQSDKVVRIEFQPSKDRYWPPSVLERNPIAATSVSGREVILTGPGAVWMYAHAAAVYCAAGAEKIRVETPGDKPGSDDLTGCQCEIRRPQRDAASLLFWVQLRSLPPLSRQVIERLLQPRLDELQQLQPREIVIGGRASNEVYARVAQAAVRAGVMRVYCWSARDGLVAVYDAQSGQLGGPVRYPAWLQEAVPPPERPVVLGVIGDPNVGKSTLCHFFDCYLQRTWRAWKLDCDGQAPTPNWYLSMVDEAQAKRLRDAQKCPWTSEMEEMIADQLRRARELFDVLVADLPGGNHAINPPQRIPPGREIMFREVDAFLIVQRQDQPTAADWLRELQNHGLESRVVAILDSIRPDLEPALRVWTENGIWRGEVCGLHRDWLKKLKRLPDAFAQELDRFLPALLESVRNLSRRGVAEG